MAVMNLVEAVRETLRAEMRRDPDVWIVGEDVGRKGGVFGATLGLYDEFGPERVQDSPLTESAIVGVGIGAALYGTKPVCEIQFADFIFPAMNQIVSEAAKMRYRSNGAWSVPMVIRAPFGGGVHGGLYHSQSVEQYFTNTAGLKVVVPSTPYDAKGLLAAAIRDPDPVLFFEHKGLYRAIKGEVPEEDYVIPIGKADVKRDGTDITVITYGKVVHFCLEAAEQLEKEGYSALVLDLRTLLPLDREAIVAAARKTGKVLIAHEASKTHGVGAEVAALIAEECLFDLDAPIQRLCGPDVPAMPYAGPMEKFYMLSPEKCLAAMRQLAQF
ncbi:2-oxoisovalerate dehydrogenase E1 component beta subunit [Symbiobacterium terraclitae]|uniref:2-oxoisovalerate dehydrogenase E1 component beta subunit n=1 Tax=Symbiobacterium terraclitae TaxID=557451 RepID=A0ABS4JRM4_9FIRM|nr:alpha-ketoacid dehydrogenase subunit beta [Symbiobacterium terraclitae]MBP2018193.1 2-oxoisovalerate dehydrogenase E1 component beta subunit [Symbiobacterium terraclitae]